MEKTDVLIVGSGIAGLSYAVKIAEAMPECKVSIITKADADETNTKYAQGGVAVVADFITDSFEKHILDTLDAGDGLCNEKVVEFVIKEGPDRIDELIQWGAKFDKEDSGDYHLGKEGGHTENRVLHHKDITGWEIERALLAKVHAAKNIELLTHHYVIDIITQHHLGRMVTRVTPDIKCYGVYVLDTESGEIEAISARVTYLGTGGVGQVYKSTTNPVIATGDGIAMVYRAKGRIESMEFIQFHPTSLFNPGESPSFLVSEAVRGFGATLKTAQGEDFMHKYDERLSLAPRDIVARAIDNELKTTGSEYVYLDCRHTDMHEFKEHFPNIYEKCLSEGIDVSKDMIPVVPAAHYSCGGIKVNEYGQTSIRNLYACGECASTGLHGSNRLASNSLLEAVVFSHRIYKSTKKQLEHAEFMEDIPEWSAAGTMDPKEMVLITQSAKELKEIMSNYVGIVRTDKRLKRAMDRLWILYRETEKLYESTTISPQLCELRNMISIGYLITRSSAMRKESRGLHYNTDYPEQNPFVEYSLL